MKRYLNIVDYKNIHFIGVGGVSVSALAEYAIAHGVNVSGSDAFSSKRTERLAKLGAKIDIGHSAKNVRKADAVVYTVAIDNKNPEYRYAKNKNIPIFTRSEFLGAITDGYKNSIAVAGCHGKTTTTAMIATVLNCAGKDPTVFLGGDGLDFGNFRLGKSHYLIAEACEYNKSFLDIKPKISVVLNIGDDHLDTYGNLEGVKKAFNSFIQGSVSVINADDENSKELYNPCTVTFGIKNTANYYATGIKKEGKFYSFTLNANSMRYGKIKLKTIGEHNVYNALATFAVCDVLGISFYKIKQGLECFNGVKRRNEYIGEKNGVQFYADYAHHPEEIKSTLNAYNENGKQMLTIFQPHTYSRTKLLMKDFIKVLKKTSKLIILDTYPAREEFDEQGSAYTLYRKLLICGQENVYFAGEEKELFALINEHYLESDGVLALGAGDVYERIKYFVNLNDENI